MLRKYLFYAFILLLSGCDGSPSGDRDASQQPKSNTDNSHDFSTPIVSSRTPKYFSCTSDPKYAQFGYDGPIISRFQSGTFTVFTHYSRLEFELETSAYRSQKAFQVKSLDVTPFHPFLLYEGHDAMLIEESISSGISLSKGARNSEVEIETATNILECKNMDHQTSKTKVDRLDAFFDSVSADAKVMRQGGTFDFRNERWWTVAYVLGVQSGACSAIGDRIIDMAKKNYDLASDEYVKAVDQIERNGCFSETTLEKIASQGKVNDMSDRAVDMVNELTDLEPYKPKLVKIFEE